MVRGCACQGARICIELISNYNYIKVRPKASRAGFVCRTERVRIARFSGAAARAADSD